MFPIVSSILMMKYTMHFSFVLTGFLLSVVCSVPALAQGGSFYSLFGLGDIQDGRGAVYEGLGGTSIAVRSSYAIGSANPATWGDIATTRLQAGFSLRQAHLTSDNSGSLSQNNSRLQSVEGVFSIDTALGISVGFGFRPFSVVSYASTRTSTVVVGGQEFSSTSEFVGKGGLTTGYLGATFRPFDAVTVGITGLYHFGRIKETQTTLFNLGDYLPSALQRSNGFSGSGITLGVLYTGVPNLTLGATLMANAPLSITYDERYVSSFSLDTTITEKRETDMPLVLGIGASYVSGKFLFAVDAATSDYTALSVRKPDFVRFRRANRASIGISRTANLTSDSFLDRWAYNFGVGYNQQNYVVYNQEIDEMYASFGVQLPIARNAYLDGAMTGGTRGTTANGLARELFVRFSFSASIGETWFKPFKRD